MNKSHADTQTHRHTDTQTHRHTDTHTDTHTDRHTHTHTVPSGETTLEDAMCFHRFLFFPQTSSALERTPQRTNVLGEQHVCDVDLLLRRV